MGDGSGWWENPESLRAGLLIIPSPSPRRTCSSAPRAGSPGRAIRHPPWGNAHTEHTFCLHLFLFFYNGSHGFPSKNKRAAGKKGDRDIQPVKRSLLSKQIERGTTRDKAHAQRHSETEQGA